ncbi:MAG: zinc-binding dehydrogenase, partial [Myxococcales bacterium]|nr:zinc-binding dehydrogenase [Myxococcales bacterium]
GTRGKWPAILPQHLFYKQVSIVASTMGSPREFSKLLEFVAEKGLVPPVDRVFPLAEGAAAFAHLAQGAQLGKVVLQVSLGG